MLENPRLPHRPMSVRSDNLIAWRQWLSPLKIFLLGLNGLCLGGCIVLLALGAVSGPLLLLTAATTLSFGALLAGAIMGSRRVIQRNDSEGNDQHDP